MKANADEVFGASSTGTSAVSALLPTATSSSAMLHLLCSKMLGPAASEALVTSHFRSAAHLLTTSSSNASAASITSSSKEQSVAERIQKLLMSDGRRQDALTFQELHARLKQSKIIRNREALLTLFFNLTQKSEQSGHHSARGVGAADSTPFFVFPLNSTANGSAESQLRPGIASSSNLSSIPSRGHLPGHRTLIHTSNPAGYHPPLPPKPAGLQSPASLKMQPTSHDQRGPPQKLHPRLTGEAENKLLRELVYTCQGIDGTMIRWDSRTERFALVESQKQNLSPSIVQLCHRIAEMGWLFNRISGFCNSKNEDEAPQTGLVIHSFITALNTELSEYYRLLAVLETELSSPDCTPHHVAVWTLEPLQRLKLLASVCDACCRSKGGALVSALHAFIFHGDASSSNTARALLATTCRPLYRMLLRWICDGVLDDPHQEFFIEAVLHDPRSAVDNAGHRLWHEKYSVRQDMVPRFLSLAWVGKILATGKNINFLREICNDDMSSVADDRGALFSVRSCLEGLSSPEKLFEDGFGSDNLLHQTVQKAYSDTSTHVLSVLVNKYKFPDHLAAMRKYLLLGQGDMIRYLLVLLEDELDQPANSLYPHNLAGILETAIRATNAQFEDPDILERLDVFLLEAQAGDKGWDVFSLKYTVAGPIGTVFSPQAMNSYLLLFNQLFRAKRIECLLSGIWMRQTDLHKMAKSVPELKPVLHIASLLTSEMIHFVHQMAYYVTFEVMECSWDILSKELKKAENLDQIISAHDGFLKVLLSQSLLDEESREYLALLRASYDRVLEFRTAQQKLYAAASNELEMRRQELAMARRRAAAGRFAVTSADEEASARRIKAFCNDTLRAITDEVRIASQSYQSTVKEFLLRLASSQDANLQLLSVRLDFNQHYKRKGVNLGTPLRFRH